MYKVNEKLKKEFKEYSEKCGVTYFMSIILDENGFTRFTGTHHNGREAATGHCPLFVLCSESEAQTFGLERIG